MLLKNSIYNIWTKFDKPFKIELVTLRNFFYYLYNPNPFKMMQKICGEYPVIVDGGAHDGGTIITLKHYMHESKIHAFEPLKNIGLKKIAGHYNDIYVNHIALGSFDGSADFNKNKYDDTSSFYEGVYPVENKITVPVTKLDTYTSKYDVRVDILKLDVQGSELEVLKGAEETLKDVKIVFTEVWFQQCYKNQCSFSDIYNFLKDFEVFSLYFPRKNTKLVACDAMFVKKGLV